MPKKTIGSNIHVAQNIYSDDLHDPLTLPAAPHTGQHFHIFIETSQHLIDELAQQYRYVFTVKQRQMFPSACAPFVPFVDLAGRIVQNKD